MGWRGRDKIGDKVAYERETARKKERERDGERGVTLCFRREAVRGSVFGLLSTLTGKYRNSPLTHLRDYINYHLETRRRWNGGECAKTSKKVRMNVCM